MSTNNRAIAIENKRQWRSVVPLPRWHHDVSKTHGNGLPERQFGTGR
jgi:hypothetical protein